MLLSPRKMDSMAEKYTYFSVGIDGDATDYRRYKKVELKQAVLACVFAKTLNLIHIADDKLAPQLSRNSLQTVADPGAGEKSNKCEKPKMRTSDFAISRSSEVKLWHHEEVLEF